MEANITVIKGPVNRINNKVHLKKEIVTLGLCISGSCVVCINYNKYEMNRHDLIMINPYTTSHLENVSNDFEGYILSVEKNYFEEIVFNNIPELVNILNFIHRNKVLHLNHEDFDFLARSYDYTGACLKQKKQKFFKSIVLHQLTTITLGIFSMLPMEQISNKQIKSRQDDIVERFLMTLKKNFHHEHRVDFYAEAQYVTSKYLSTVVKKATGETVSNWINKFITMEAKMQLKSTSKTVQQIAIGLNFPNQSFFGKYFKKNTNQTPSQYRNE